jgi:ketosteroid isomerase-like protein
MAEGLEVAVLERATLTDWLERYRQAWEERDPDLAAALFTDDATYAETPFAEPFQGPDGVRNYWATVTPHQQDPKFRYEVLAVDEEAGRGIAWWHCELTVVETGSPIVLDGIFVLDFADDGRVRTLREWWHLDEPGKASE